MRLLHPALALAIALAGCSAATAKWEKPGAKLPQIDEDLQQCRVEVRTNPGMEMTSATPRGQTGDLNIARMEDRDTREAELVQRCMLAKGYTAVR
jgi:hypothetical protein